LNQINVSKFLDDLLWALDKHRKKTKINTSVYLSEVELRQKFYLKAKKELNKELAHDFNIFDFINTDERKLSAVIEFLLNPSSSHGQGITFLKLFLSMLQRKTDLLNSIDTYKLNDTYSCCEYLIRTDKISYKMLDVFVLLNNNTEEFVVALENKPFVGEHYKQVANYIEFLDNKYLDKYLFVFLSSRGEDPVSILDKKLLKRLKSKGILVILSYDDLAHMWLQFCFKECEAEKIRWFLRDFISYIKINIK